MTNKNDFPKAVPEPAKTIGVSKPSEESQEQVVRDITFAEKVIALGRLIRANAAENLKFDSNIGNINYDYVDTQQYKNLVAKCCDELGIGVGFNTKFLDYDSQKNDKGSFVYTVFAESSIVLYGSGKDEEVYFKGIGFGVSTGGGYAASIATTNSMRNILTNAFMLPTSDREDDVKLNAPQNEAKAYLSDTEKNEKREKLLAETKSTVEYATVQFGKIIRKRAEDVLKGEVPDDFRATLTKFLESKYNEDGSPKTLEGNDTMWIVKKTAATKILGDLDKYGN